MDELSDLSAKTQAALAALPRHRLERGKILFRAGDAAEAFLLALSGRVDVFLTGPSGREILLYSVEPGQSCVQTTLGLLAQEPYSGEAIVAEDAEIILVPHVLFDQLMTDDPGFRIFVMQALGRRMTDVTRLLERVAFCRIEARLAATLLDLARDGIVHATQADLAAHVGSAREVISRRLEAFTRDGLVETERGLVRLSAPDRLRQLAASLV